MMYEFMQAVLEALQAEAGPTGLIECTTSDRMYLYRPDAETTLPCIVVWSGMERTIRADGDYDYSEFTAAVNAYQRLGPEDEVATRAYMASALGRRIKRALLNNPNLVGTSNPLGLLAPDEDAQLQVTEIHYIEESVLPVPSGRPASQVQLVVKGRINTDHGTVMV
jgi:hypothetical protein